MSDPKPAPSRVTSSPRTPNPSCAPDSSRTPNPSRVLRGRDLITVGIFTALYVVVNFVFMLISGLHPYLWVFMPALDALFAGIPFMLACAKVPKFGTVLIMGMVPSLIYFVTGMFTPLILGMMLGACLLAELIRAATRYRSFAGNALAYAVFGFGMCGSPLPLWVFHDSFVAQIAGQGMGADYLATFETAANPAMLVAMLVSTFVAGLVGAYLARGMFKKHFEKAGLA